MLHVIYLSPKGEATVSLPGARAPVKIKFLVVNSIFTM